MTEILQAFCNHFTFPVRSANAILFSLITFVQYNILIEILNGRKHLVALVVDNRIILKLAYRNEVGSSRTGFRRIRIPFSGELV
jgi:hypothetical protein